jgi:hypothetical protein
MIKLLRTQEGTVMKFSAKILCMILFPSLLSGCHSVNPFTPQGEAEILHIKPLPQYKLSQDEKLIMRSEFQHILKDPESARFGHIAAGRDSEGNIFVCGLVNAKNSYGGYTGEQPYMGFFENLDNKKIFTILHFGGEAYEQHETFERCSYRGLNP